MAAYMRLKRTGSAEKRERTCLAYRCSQCGVELNERTGRKNASRKTGMAGWCRECNRKAVAATRARDPEYARKRWKALPPHIRRERQTGIRTYVIKSKDIRSIPSEFDQAIQQTQCTMPECPGVKGLYCRNPDHIDNRIIVGGLYPHLRNRGTQNRPITKPYELHWSIDDTKARAAAALEAAKLRLAEANNARDAFLIAQADLAGAKADIAEAERRMLEADVPIDKTAELHKQIISQAGGQPESKPTQSANAQPNPGQGNKNHK